MKIGMVAGLWVVLTFVLHPVCKGQEENSQEVELDMKRALEFLYRSEEAGNQQRLEKLHAMLLEKSARLQSMSETLGTQHPEIEQLQAQIAEMEKLLSQQAKMEAADPKVHETRVVHAMLQQMQELGDAMESLGNQIDRMKKLESEFDGAAIPSRTEFFESVDKMFTTGKSYFGELEKAMAQKQNANGRISLSLSLAHPENPLVQRFIEARTKSVGELAQASALESRDRAVRAALLAASSANDQLARAVPGNQRMEQVEARLARIESMLEKLVSITDEDDK